MSDGRLGQKSGPVSIVQVALDDEVQDDEDGDADGEEDERQNERKYRFFSRRRRRRRQARRRVRLTLDVDALKILQRRSGDAVFGDVFGDEFCADLVELSRPQRNALKVKFLSRARNCLLVYHIFERIGVSHFKENLARNFFRIWNEYYETFVRCYSRIS